MKFIATLYDKRTGLPTLRGTFYRSPGGSYVLTMDVSDASPSDLATLPPIDGRCKRSTSIAPLVLAFGDAVRRRGNVPQDGSD